MKEHPQLASSYEVTRSLLSEAEELLFQAAEEARKEGSATDGIELVEILSLAIGARRLRCKLEGSA